MSNDQFWEKWNKGQGQAGGGAEQSKPPGGEAADTSSVDADVLANWLKALPPADPVAPAGGATPAPSPASPSDLAALWPPAAPVDPFTGIQKSAGAPASSDWDLALDLTPPAAAAPPPPAAPAPPSAPSAPPTGVGDFALNLGGLAGPVPAANPFAPPDSAGTAVPPPAPPAPAVNSPFGPPPPPVAPPAESLQAPPLRLTVTTGRRSQELEIQGEALIGRPDATRGIHPEIDLRLDDAVSRRHAKIFVKNGVYVLTDLNSTNGTRYNREWVQPEKEFVLKAGDEIEVGELTLIRVIEAPNPHA